MIKKVLNVNGIDRTLIVDQEALLCDVLRKQLQLTGTKVGCGTGVCGACNVIVDGKLVRSCVTKMKRIPNLAKITTIEGIGSPLNLHPIQKAFIFHGAIQCGFCTPGFVVSTKVLLDQNPNPTREQVRDWFQKHRNACRCTGYIMIVNAVMDAAKVLRGEMPVSAIEYKTPADGKVYGTCMPRPTSVAKACGLWDFGEDMRQQLPENTLECALVQPEVSHAIIKGIDTSEAEKMPGVVKVVTHKDVKGKNRITGLITFPTNKGDGWDRPILNDEKIFQYGDVVAIVCADTRENAKAAAAKVKVDLEVLPSYMNAIAAKAEDAIEIHPGTPNVYYDCIIKKGEETKPIFEKAAHVAEGYYYLQRQPHMPIEPDVGFAYIDDDKRVIVHSKSIGIHLHHAMICPGLGLEPEQLVLIQNPTGATFGYKFSPTMEALVAVATMATGRPCFLGYDWAQQQFYTGKRSPAFLNVRLAADEEGNFLGLESDWDLDHGPYSEFGDLVTVRQAQFCGAGYDIRNIRGHGRTVCTNHGWGSAFRAYGSPQAFMASESLVDELAKQMGVDPFELRYKNLYREGATTPTGQEPEVLCFPEMFDILRPKYKAAVERAKRESTDTKKRGVGISLGIYGCGLDGPDTSGAWAQLEKDGSVTIGNAWECHGQGADMGTVAFAHHTLRPLGLSADQINLCMNDTSLTPNSGPSGGSRQNVVTGNAIHSACTNLLNAMRKSDGSFRTYDEMVADGKELKYEGTWTTPCTHMDLDTQQGKPFCIYMYALFMAEVEVDVTTGKVDVLKMTYVGDNGTITNRLVVDGQVYGGLAQGIGLALTEDFEFIKKHSNMVGAGFPYIKDITDDMELIYIETPRKDGAFGQAGVGEGPLTSPHVSIVNAIDNACGVRIRHLPVYPEKVLAALKSEKKSFDVEDAFAGGFFTE
ncbi:MULTISPECIES: molybdopterin-dependent aldehyde oxidoreductase [Syntrophotalea]|jgi:aldehyde oxidoreductase|uniref:Aldehyde oxidoreductase n=1 Tax=Syntrophotalea acetylenica TaxID=29542 RepID=A0A1L3GF83_SYNAC|nr:molybdopterin-dependent aldehyde oxidoreductase [Syntrophotalea acetylenica]APG24593.1 aldehyde oxidoreductase [Syntrophotalea acetylenica]APG45176.1 aldehyde oxidoreductase [Syntrophotalea acetylenica]MDY0263175.1 molybdopterin-dependent oxidoreductase [Syntrophotalea acetylenica]